MIVDLSRAAAELNLESRLSAIPASASVRGVFFTIVEDVMVRRGFPGLTRWPNVLGESPRSYRFYEARHLIAGLGRVGAVVGPDPSEGIREIFRSFAGSVSQTWYGRTMQKVLRPDPASALRFIESKREYVANYAQWRVESRGPSRALLHMTDEYIWIESAQRGGCEGLLTACGVTGEVTAELDGPYAGHLDIRW